jgi:hypothetical protein
MSELRDAAGVFQGLLARNRRAQERIDAGAHDELDWAALGYTIHNIYSAAESYCLLVAKFFENDLDPRTWHRDLIRRMTLDIPGVRPRLLGRELAEALDELRGFRHVFRNLYGAALDPERVRLAQARVVTCVDGFLEAHEAFLVKLAMISGSLTEED